MAVEFKVNIREEEEEGNRQECELQVNSHRGKHVSLLVSVPRGTAETAETAARHFW